MKKLLLILFSVFVAGATQASHLMGGQITAGCLGTGFDYQITLTLYRDTLGIPMYSTETVYVSSDTATGAAPDTAVQQLPPAVNFGNGVEEYTYQFNYTFPGPGDYIIYWSNCCRNGAILNLPNPSSNSMALSTIVHVDSCNSTPVFLNPPIPVAQLGVPFTYNSLPFDADGDSIAWRLDIPQDIGVAGAGSVTTSILGYVDPFSDTTQPFSLDPVTGEISFLPNTMGNFVVSVAVDEFRGSVKIGQIRRDMQIIVVGPQNSPRLFNFTSNVAPVSGRTIRINPNTNFHLVVSANDPIDNDLLSIVANGSAFLLPSNAPTFTTASNSGEVTGTMDWTPTTSEGSDRPYITCFRVGEIHGGFTFYRDETFSIYVNRSVGIDEAEQASVSSWMMQESVLNGQLTLTTSGLVDIGLYAMNGQLIKTIHRDYLAAGKHQFAVDASALPSGIYLIALSIDGKPFPSQKVIK